MQDILTQHEKWKGQFRKGFLELCVLTALKRRERLYGVELIDLLAHVGIEIAEGTLYPMLVRLANEQMLISTWETPESGHPRKFYALSDFGRLQLEKIAESYEEGYRAYKSLEEELQ